MAMTIDLKHVDRLKNGSLRFRRKFPKRLADSLGLQPMQAFLKNREGQAIDLPLNCHPVGTRAGLVDTPSGAGGATDIRAELSDSAARLSVAVSRRSANALGVS